MIVEILHQQIAKALFKLKTLTMNVKNQWKERFVSAVAVALIFLFAYTAFAKIMNLRNFRFALMQQPILSSYAKGIAIAVPVIEVALIFLLTVPMLRSAGLGASALLMSLFTIYVGLMLFFSSSLPCSCGGIIEAMSWKMHLVFNAVATVLSWIAFAWHYQKEQRILLQ